MSDLFAALDLGSNSFHLLLARRTKDGFEAVERLKEKVQLLRGFRGGRLHPDAMARGAACLQRFAQRLAALPRGNIAMAGTHALREAANRGAFVEAAERIMAVPLEVVTGTDEARLVNLGVAHCVPYQAGVQRLVVDIGGGSTELAWSGQNDPDGLRVASFKVGCVALTDRHFGGADGQSGAYLAARDEALGVLAELSAVGPGWEAMGTSGTVESVQTVLEANGWGGDRIHRAGVEALTDAVVSGRWLVEAGLPGLPPERVDIFAAGLAVLDALFRRLQIDELRYVDASLQDGLLDRHAEPGAGRADLRMRTVARLKRHYRVDEAQAQRVCRTARALFEAAAPWWPEPDRWRALLDWAAQLHEVGLTVSPRQYHRHGAYLLQNADLRAFSQTERQHLILLLRGHRRAFPGLAFRGFDAQTRRSLIRTLALLRIAVILERSHHDADSPRVAAGAAEGSTEDTLRLMLPVGWLSAHPLSAKELAVETGQLAGAGICLEVA
jgi:exopolyphosphatase/guanosine-5'-triphosphate,3'-diphosphate pyrophosphatase